MTGAPAPAVFRYCFVRLADAEQATRDDLAAALQTELTAACAPHPVWVGLPADDSAARWDLAITIALPRLAAWQELSMTPGFASVMQHLSDRAAVVKAWTFAAVSR
jgi:hypothetical protein